MFPQKNPPFPRCWYKVIKLFVSTASSPSSFRSLGSLLWSSNAVRVTRCGEGLGYPKSSDLGSKLDNKGVRPRFYGGLPKEPRNLQNRPKSCSPTSQHLPTAVLHLLPPSASPTRPRPRPSDVRAPGGASTSWRRSGRRCAGSGDRRHRSGEDLRVRVTAGRQRGATNRPTDLPTYQGLQGWSVGLLPGVVFSNLPAKQSSHGSSQPPKLQPTNQAYGTSVSVTARPRSPRPGWVWGVFSSGPETNLKPKGKPRRGMEGEGSLHLRLEGLPKYYQGQRVKHGLTLTLQSTF